MQKAATLRGVEQGAPEELANVAFLCGINLVGRLSAIFWHFCPKNYHFFKKNLEA
jgi:hypothetical protein